VLEETMRQSARPLDRVLCGHFLEKDTINWAFIRLRAPDESGRREFPTITTVRWGCPL
jgi:hypothetical protein